MKIYSLSRYIQEIFESTAGIQNHVAYMILYDKCVIAVRTTHCSERGNLSRFYL